MTNFQSLYLSELRSFFQNFEIFLDQTYTKNLDQTCTRNWTKHVLGIKPNMYKEFGPNGKHVLGIKPNMYQELNQTCTGNWTKHVLGISTKHVLGIGPNMYQELHQTCTRNWTKHLLGIWKGSNISKLYILKTFSINFLRFK